MGSSFVGIGNHGFWMRDGDLTVWLRLLALHVEDPAAPGTTATAIRDGWLLASRGFFVGCMPNGLEQAVSTDEGAALVRAAIASLMAALAAAPPQISKDVLNLLGIVGTFTRDYDTCWLMEVGQAFTDLIDGKIVTGDCASSFVPSLR